MTRYWNAQITYTGPSGTNRWGDAFVRRCSHRLCKADGVYEGAFHYITGREGRVSERRLYLCAEHATVFAQTHELALPAPVGTIDEIRPHDHDADCDLGADDCCRVCGVYHGDPCPVCGGRGYHLITCSEVLPAAGQEE